jgi:LmbE family N-acetylglucosaminyl deacetylase
MLPLTLSPAGAPTGPLRLLFLGAHSDDIEIGCGGTILRFLAEHPGSEVTWVVFSANPEREREARASAAAFLGDAPRTVEIKAFRESYFPDNATLIKDAFEELKRSMVRAPDIVFTHRRQDRHQDHRVVSELTWNTFRNHLILEYEIPKYEGDLGNPNLFVPLPRAVADKKAALLMEHFPSQAGRTWFRPDTFHGLMSIRGVECNAAEARAEAFHAHKLLL